MNDGRGFADQRAADTAVQLLVFLASWERTTGSFKQEPEMRPDESLARDRPIPTIVLWLRTVEVRASHMATDRHMFCRSQRTAQVVASASDRLGERDTAGRGESRSARAVASPASGQEAWGA